jgi:hypothetical protein
MTTLDITNELAALSRMSVGQLHDRYAEVFGEAARSRHRQYLVRRIAWRVQANAEGGLSDRALRRAEELANDADVRVTPPSGALARPARTTPPRPDVVAVPPGYDPRLPRPGTAIVRDYKGRRLLVTVLPDGFEYDGERYRSLSAIAKAVTGSHMNGFRFFGLEATQ